jgi:hypothetical protein
VTVVEDRTRRAATHWPGSPAVSLVVIVGPPASQSRIRRAGRRWREGSLERVRRS